MYVFFYTEDNNTKHDYYTVQEIVDGTEERIKEMIHTTYKNRRDRVNKEKESSVDGVFKKQKTQARLNFTGKSGGESVDSFVAASTLTGPAPEGVEVSMEDTIRVEMDGYHHKAWTVRLPDPNSSQVSEVYTLEEPDEWWTYQRKIGNLFPLLYKVWQCVSRKRGNTDPRYF